MHFLYAADYTANANVRVTPCVLFINYIDKPSAKYIPA